MTIQNMETAPITLEQSDLWRQRGYVEEDALLPLLAGLCQVLGHGHDGGETHGRICPSSILLDDAGGVCLDSSYAPAQGTQQGAVSNPLFGVLPDGYAAFEQYMDEEAWPVGPWTDIHAVGAVAYALVVGRAPDNAVKRMVAGKPVEFAAKYQSRFSPKLVAAIARALSTDARARQQSVDEFMVGLSGLNALAEQQPDLSESIERTAATPREAHASPVDMYADTGSGLDGEEGGDDLTERASALAATTVFQDNHTKKSTVGWGMPLVVVLLLATGAGIWLFKGTDGGSTNVAVAESRRLETAMPGVSDGGDTANNPPYNDRVPSHDSVAITQSNAQAIGGEASHNPAAGMPKASDTSPASIDGASSGVPASATSEVTDALSPDHANTLLGAVALQDRAGSPKAAEQTQAALQEGVNGQGETEWSVAPDGLPSPAGATPKPEKASEQADSKEPVSVTVRVNILPWGEVFVDGSSKGVSPPLRQLALPPGNYRIRIQNGDLPQANQQLTVKAGEPARIQHVFAGNEP